MAEQAFDVVIGGGGPVGLALAAALAGQGLKMALVDAREPEVWSGETMDPRVSSLTLASQRMLERLGAWQRMAERRVSPYEAIHAWDAGGGGVRFHAADIGEPWLGHIVENGLLQWSLRERLAALDGGELQLLMPARVEGLDPADEGWRRLRLDDGRRLRTRLLVAADGGGSPLRHLAGIATSERDYGQQGLVATVRAERHHDLVARQRFLPGGPLALLPLADGRCSIVWSLPAAEADRILALPEPAFLDNLTTASDGVLGTMQETGPRAGFPLRARQAVRYVDDRLALVGDAAHVIHPLAGQGVNLGLLDAATLAEQVLAAAARGGDPGGWPALRRYERWRRSDNQPMQWAMDGFHWLFSNTDPLRFAARNLGFRLTDRLPFLKRRLTRYAVGLRDDLPGLARLEEHGRVQGST